MKVLVVGEPHKTSFLVKKCLNSSQVSYLPRLSKEQVERKGRMEVFAEEFVRNSYSGGQMVRRTSQTRKSMLPRLFRSTSADSWKTGGSRFKVNQAFQSLVSSDNESALRRKLLGTDQEPKEGELEVFSSVLALASSEKFQFAFICVDYDKILTADGAHFLSEVIDSLKKSDSNKPAVLCFDVLHPKVLSLLTRFEMKNVEVVFLHPFTCNLNEKSDVVEVVSEGVLTERLDASLSLLPGFQTSDMNINEAVKFLPLLLLSKSQCCLPGMSKTLENTNDRTDLLLTTVQSVLPAEVSFNEDNLLQKMKDLTDFFSKKNMKTLQVKKEVQNIRRVLTENYESGVKEVLSETNFVENFPNIFLEDSEKKEFEETIRNYESKKLLL